MRHLLAPGDERDLVAFLCETLGAKLVLSDLTTAGNAHLAADPLAALPEALPGPAAFGDHAVWTLMFWLSTVGPIRTLADAPPPDTPPDGVARRLSVAAARGRAVVRGDNQGEKPATIRMRLRRRGRIEGRA